MRVTKGYVVTNLLNDYPLYIRDAAALQSAIAESDIKQEGSGTAVNLNITVEANDKLADLKKLLDKETGRSLFPAQVIDILLICARNLNGRPPVKEVSDKQLAKVMMEYAYKLLTEEVLPVNISNARSGIIKIFEDNCLL
ncbi:hypothetical protein [uncultured Acetatifactor sp.]|jgi:NAD(P)-dependent dehydrogenase (short-subunit alcohol dehydrogenase family)|nr:hypothetical protein [uncultured Acetatifactor sp.]